MKLAGAIQRFRRWRLGRRGVVIDRSSFVHGNVFVAAWPGVHKRGAVLFGAGCELGLGSEFNPWEGHIHIGERVFFGPYVIVYGQGGVEIDDGCIISIHCCILSSNHPIVSRDKMIRDEPNILLPTKIGRDCWLGAGTKVLGGVQIGDGCIVGAGAVVTKDLPAYSIAVGVPAHVVGYRPA
jgi:acetyltransferase-like isoleucine patch superfamily enzyme